MKNFFTLTLCFLTLSLTAQTLEYNKTIDTLLSITIPNGTVFSSSNWLISGNYISVPTNKVWKVQSIMIFTPGDEVQNGGNTTLHYLSGSSWGNLTSVSGKIALMLRNNGTEHGLFESAIPATQQSDDGSNFIDRPLWLSQSDLGIAFTHSHNSATPPYLIIDYTGYVHLSILEFNTQ